MIPIVMGSITIIFCLWVMGKSNRNYLIDKILANDSNKYVFSNGIYVPKKMTKRNLLREKLKKISGFSDIKPVILLFLMILLLFGVHRMVLVIFVPSLTTWIPNRLFASGIEDYLLADLWRMIPEAQDLNQVYYYIEKNLEYEHSIILLFSIEAYLKLFIVIVFTMLIRGISKKRIENKKRLLISLLVICILLIITYFVQIQSYNKETAYRCHEIYYQLANENYVENEEDIDVYIQKVQEEKERFEEEFYFDAYHIRINGIELIENLIKEIYRFHAKNK
jgi:Na+/melibiose symporter-like transporter